MSYGLGRPMLQLEPVGCRQAAGVGFGAVGCCNTAASIAPALRIAPLERAPARRRP